MTRLGSQTSDTRRDQAGGSESATLAKYDMTSHPIRDLLQRIALRYSKDFEPTESVTLTIRDDECPEELGDELRLWCHRHCEGRSKHTMRGVRGIIAMGFESTIDAAMFRASALNDCRAVIAANNRRRRAAQRRVSR